MTSRFLILQLGVDSEFPVREGIESECISEGLGPKSQAFKKRWKQKSAFAAVLC